MNMEKDNLYCFSKTMLAVVAWCSLITSVLTMFKVDNGIFFSAFIPAEVAVLNVYQLDTTFNDTLFFFLTFGTILLYFICYGMAGKRLGWLLAGFVLYLIDTIVMGYYIYRNGMNMSWGLELFFHALVLTILLFGYFSIGMLALVISGAKI